MHPDDRQAVDAAYSGSLREDRDTYEIEHRVVRKDSGEIRLVHERCDHLRDAAGKIVRSVGMVHDITETKLAEAALRESELRYRSLADGLPFPVWMSDAEGGDEFVNRAYKEFFGVADEQVLGSNWEALLHPEDRESYLAEFKAAVRERRDFHAEIRERAADGQWHWIESFGSPRYSSMRKFLGMVGCSPDITERRLATEVLRDSEARLRMASHGGVVGLYEWNATGDTPYWGNPEAYELFGLDPDGPVTFERWLDCVHPDDRERLALTMAELRRLGAPQPLPSVRRDQYRVLQRDGRVVWLEAVNTVDREGEEIVIRGGVRDITDRKLAEEAAQESHRRAELLAWTASSLLSTDDPRGLVEELCRRAMAELDCQVFTNYLVDEDQGRPHLNAYAGISASEAKRIEWLDSDVTAGACEVEKELLAAKGVTAYACHPLMVQEEVLGTLSFGTRSRPHFSDDDLALMKSVAAHVAMAVHHWRAEAERRRYELLAADSRDIMLFMDRVGRILDANLAAEQVYGYSRAELLALSIADLRAPDTHGDLHIQMAEADESGILFETAHRRKDGSVFPVEVSARGATIAGRRTLLSVVRDISERKRAEETLSRNLATLSRSQETGHIGSWALDFETGAFEASDEDYRIHGLVPGSPALLDLVWTLIHPDDLDRFREYVESVQHEGQLGGIDYRIVRPDGAVRHVYAETADVVRGPDGRVRLASGITQDVTERKLAELEVLERARLSDALTAIDALVHSSLDTRKAVEAALSEGAIALGASTAVVTTHQDGGFRIDHLFGAPATELGRVIADEHDPAGLTALATGEPVVLEDAQADPRMSPMIAERYGVRSLLVVPLASERDAVGCLYFVFQERPHVFTRAEIDFGRKLGATLSFAIENARLYEEQQRIAADPAGKPHARIAVGARPRDRHDRAIRLRTRTRGR